MTNDSPNDSPRDIWQNQPMEAQKMTLETVRHRASKSRSQTRRELLVSIAMVLIVVVISVFGILHTSNAGIRTLFALAILWALAGQSFLHHGMWSAGLPVDATLYTGLKFYGREVERQQDLVRRILQWSFGPIVLSIVTSIVTLASIARGHSLPIRVVMPFTTLFVIWIIAFFVLRARGQRKLRRELEELSDQ